MQVKRWTDGATHSQMMKSCRYTQASQQPQAQGVIKCLHELLPATEIAPGQVYSAAGCLCTPGAGYLALSCSHDNHILWCSCEIVTQPACLGLDVSSKAAAHCTFDRLLVQACCIAKPCLQMLYQPGVVGHLQHELCNPDKSLLPQQDIYRSASYSGLGITHPDGWCTADVQGM